MTSFGLSHTHVHLGADGATELLDSARLRSRVPADLDDAHPIGSSPAFRSPSTSPPVPPRCEKDAATAQRLHHLTPNLTLEEFEALPTVLFGTAVQIAEKLHVHRKCYGFSYITVLEGAMEPFAKVIELLRGS
jgi:hypothetical protein